MLRLFFNIAAHRDNAYNLKMGFLKRVKPEWILRLTLGLMFLYSGSNLFYRPSDWYGFAPQWFSDFWSSFASFDIYLRLQGIGEFIIGLLLLAWFGGKWGVKIGSLLATIEVGLILLLTGVDLITFRDLGVFGAAFTLLVLSFFPETDRQNNAL